MVSHTPQTSPPENTINIVLLLCENMLISGHTTSVEMFQTAYAMAKMISKADNLATKPIRFYYTANTTDPVTTRARIQVSPDTLIHEVTHTPDLVVIPSLWRNPRRIVQQHHDYLDHLKRWYLGGAELVAAGTGACFLAEAGLLNHHPATTHWHYFDQFERDYPNVQLKRDFFITQSERLYCAASLNAMADLTVHFIQKYFGLTCAHHVERHFSHEIRQPYEQRRFLQGDANQHTDEEILNLQLWLRQHMDTDIQVESAAEISGISPRTLSRRFKLATGQSFNEYLTQLRIDTARDLLQNSNLPIGDVADRVGYKDSAYFSRLFKRTTGISPREYRNTVRRKVFSLNDNDI